MPHLSFVDDITWKRRVEPELETIVFECTLEGDSRFPEILVEYATILCPSASVAPIDSSLGLVCHLHHQVGKRDQRQLYSSICIAPSLLGVLPGSWHTFAHSWLVRVFPILVKCGLGETVFKSLSVCSTISEMSRNFYTLPSLIAFMNVAGGRERSSSKL